MRDYKLTIFFLPILIQIFFLPIVTFYYRKSDNLLFSAIASLYLTNIFFFFSDFVIQIFFFWILNWKKIRIPKKNYSELREKKIWIAWKLILSHEKIMQHCEFVSHNYQKSQNLWDKKIHNYLLNFVSSVRNRPVDRFMQTHNECICKFEKTLTLFVYLDVNITEGKAPLWTEETADDPERHTHRRSLVLVEEHLLHRETRVHSWRITTEIM